MNNKEILLSIKDLKTYFPIKKGVIKRTVGAVKAVDGINLDIYKGETIALVGESGCGKTTLGKAILNLVKSTNGEVLYNFDGKFQDILKLNQEEMKMARSKMQIIFQDPYSSLNPAFTIFGSLRESLSTYGIKSKQTQRKIISDLLCEVNLSEEALNRYPNEFSGGQRQRIGIARALLINPELIVCDEAVSALDVSIQAQVLKLLEKFKQERNLTYLFITHNLSVVEYFSDRVAVMYLGRIVELCKTEELFSNPLHPYTKALLSAIPVADIDYKKNQIILKGDVPSPVNPPSGCPFHTRCQYVTEQCKKVVPKLININKDNDEQHWVSCHLYK